MKKKLFIIIIITVILFLAFVGVMFKMIIENGKCVDNPFKYSAIKLKESGGNYLCSCQSLDPELLDFSFNGNGIEIIKPITKIDFSNIKVKGGIIE